VNLRQLLTKAASRGAWRRLYAFAVFTLFHGLLAFAALNVVAWIVLATVAPDPINRTYGARRYALVYPGHSPAEVRELLRETWSRPITWEPFTEYRERRYQGRFVNVHPAGFRLSRGQAPWPPSSERLNVYVFGGSTTFGYGVADDETIVSGLQAFLDARLGAGRAACYNFGRGSYYSTTERILFENLLAEGDVPKAAVFVDGLNEFAFGAPFPAELLRMAVNLPVRGALAELERELPLAQLVARAKAGRVPRGSDAELAAHFDDASLLDTRIERYESNRRLIRAAASAWGVRTLFVWQPVPTYRYDLRYHLFGDLDFGINNYSGFGYARMAERWRREPPAPDFLWAADMQDGMHEPLYVDQVHYTAAMSALVGEWIGCALLEGGMLTSSGYALLPRCSMIDSVRMSASVAKWASPSSTLAAVGSPK
jgi:hypothetical protein